MDADRELRVAGDPGPMQESAHLGMRTPAGTRRAVEIRSGRGRFSYNWLLQN
jgi:hypothetical protein